MKKKAAKRKISRKKKDYDYSHLIVGYSIVIFAAVCLFLIVTVTYGRLSNAGVLGMSTLLAESGSNSGGEDHFVSGEQGEVEDGNKGPQEQSGRPSRESMPQPSGRPLQSGDRIKNIRIEQRGKEGIMIREGSVGARTKFPLNINREGKRLTLSTPSGEKEINVMPDDAIKSLILRKVISKFDDKANNASSSVTLTEKNNKPVFEISGVSKQRLFGFIPVDVHKSVDVSAQTGQVISQNESLGQRILDFFSL